MGSGVCVCACVCVCFVCGASCEYRALVQGVCAPVCACVWRPVCGGKAECGVEYILLFGMPSMVTAGITG